MKTGQKEVLVSPNQVIDGKRNTLTNSVAVDKKGQAYYFTTSSTRFGYNEGWLEFLSNGTGRLMRFKFCANGNSSLNTRVGEKDT